MRKINKMAYQLTVATLMAASLSLPAMADDEYYDNARVINVTPQTERVNMPRQECHTEYVRENYSYNNDRSPAGGIIGGIAGGLLGSTIGRGNGRIAAAAVGAGVGAVVGDRIGNQPNSVGSVDRPVDRCVSVDNWQIVNRGYLVRYNYNGRDYTTVTDNDPGNVIRVRVGVSDGRSAPQVSYYGAAAPGPVAYREPAYVNRGYPVPPVMVYGGGYDGRDWDEGRREREHEEHEFREHHEHRDFW